MRRRLRLTAIATVLLRPGRVLRVRRSRRRWRSIPQRSLRSFFPPRGQQLRHTIETLAGSLTIEADVQAAAGSRRVEIRASRRRSRLLRLGRIGSLASPSAPTGSAAFRRCCCVVQLVAWRGLYRSGVLHGGALLPTAKGASDVWQAYVVGVASGHARQRHDVATVNCCAWCAVDLAVRSRVVGRSGRARGGASDRGCPRIPGDEVVRTLAQAPARNRCRLRPQPGDRRGYRPRTLDHRARAGAAATGGDRRGSRARGRTTGCCCQPER